MKGDRDMACGSARSIGVSGGIGTASLAWPFTIDVSDSLTSTSPRDIDIRIEDADRGPERLAGLDELEMTRVILISVVSCLVAEDHVKGDIKALVIDVSIELFSDHASAEMQNSFVAGEVLAAGFDQLLSVLRSVFGEGEEDHMADCIANRLGRRSLFLSCQGSDKCEGEAGGKQGADEHGL